jgi:hypothetical protein
LPDPTTRTDQAAREYDDRGQSDRPPRRCGHGWTL